jgi:TonB family protein
MQMMRCAAVVLLAGSAAVSQDLKPIERELQNRYQNQTLNMAQLYDAADVTFDSTGAVLGRPMPVCGERFAVEGLSLTSDEVVFTGRRLRNRRVIVARSSSDPAPVHPDDSGEPQRIHIRLNGRTSDRGEILAAIERSQRLPPVKFQSPEDAQAAAPAGDPRIVYVLPEGPVYRAIEGITPPQAHLRDQPAPDYPPEASKTGACGHVQLRAVVQEDGSVAHVRAGTPPVGWGFDEKAIEAVRKWKFDPAMLGGRPVKVEIGIETSFSAN